MKDGTDVKTEKVQTQVDEVTAVMDKNIQTMMERGERLDDLEKKTGKTKTNLRTISNAMFLA
jgi:hypothetical protein